MQSIQAFEIGTTHMCTQSHLLEELDILTLISIALIKVRLRVCDGSISGCWEHFPPEEVSFDQQQHTRCWDIFSVCWWVVLTRLNNDNNNNNNNDSIILYYIILSVWWWVVLTRLKPPLNIFLSDRLSHNLDGGWRRRVIKRRWRWALSPPPAFPFHPCPWFCLLMKTLIDS